MEVSLPGEQVQPLPKMGNKNRKNNQKSKPNGFICFAHAQKKALASQYNITGPQMLVELCDPLWRKLSADEKKMWTHRAKEEHARAKGREYNGASTDAALRMDCNRKFIVERQNEVLMEKHRRDRERQLIREELERCDEVMDKDFYIIDALTIVEYLEGECVPCEIGVVKCSIRDGIIQHQHFFPDPGPLRAGHLTEALERCELVHEIAPRDFMLATKKYDEEVSRLIQLINLKSPKTPFIFARSSEATKVESCLHWLSFRVNEEFQPKVMLLETFVEEVVNFSGNEAPSFAQITRLLYETKFDFVAGNRCEYHGNTDKIACAIGNVRKYFYFISEFLYDYYTYRIVAGHHVPRNYEPSYGGSRAGSVLSRSMASSVCGPGDQFSDTLSVRSSFSVGSYQHKRDMDQVKGPSKEQQQQSRGRGRSTSSNSSRSTIPNNFDNITNISPTLSPTSSYNNDPVETASVNSFSSSNSFSSYSAPRKPAASRKQTSESHSRTSTPSTVTSSPSYQPTSYTPTPVTSPPYTPKPVTSSPYTPTSVTSSPYTPPPPALQPPTVFTTLPPSSAQAPRVARVGGRGYQPTTQSYQPTTPSYQPTTQSYQPTAPSYQPTTPSYQPTTQSYQPTTHSYQPTTQSYQPTTQSYQPTTPSYQPTTPSYQTASLSGMGRGRGRGGGSPSSGQQPAEVPRRPNSFAGCKLVKS